MRDYGVVSPKFWIGETGKRLRKDPPAQVLALYLMTNPHSNMTGVYHCPMLYIAHETGLGDEGAMKALDRLIKEGFCEYDGPSEYVFVVNMAFWQIAERLKPGDHRIKGVTREVDKMHKAFKSRFLEVYAAPFLLRCCEDETPDDQGPCNPLISQDQDQDQEQESEGARTQRSPRRTATRLPEDFSLTDQRRLVAEAERLPAERTFSKFCDYWKAASGAKSRKLDWEATWRNWCRTEADRRPQGAGGAGSGRSPFHGAI